jgi:predicted nucleic acid-binding protein
VILVDTNVLVAAANDRDNNHRSALGLLETTAESLLVPPTVIAEVCYLLHERAGSRAEVQFLRAFEVGELDLAELTLADLRRSAELADQYADLGLGGTDASIVAIAERLDIAQLATFDRRHFSVVRPHHLVEGFTLLPAGR